MQKTKQKNIQSIDKQTAIKVIGIVVIILVISFLFYLWHTTATPPYGQQTTTQTSVSLYPTTNPALITSSLTFVKQPSSVDINLNTGSTAVSAIQIVISYDPTMLTNVVIHPGTFFTNPTVLQNTIDTTKGIISYTIAIPMDATQKTGNGTVATISYQLTSGAKTTMTFRPETKITSEGINDSVLKTALPISLP